MSYQAYLTNIEAKTGQSPTDFARLAAEKEWLDHGQLKPSVKAGQVVQWLKDDFDLGHGHAMAIYKYLKELSE